MSSFEPEEFSLTRVDSDTNAVVTVVGELDVATSPKLRELLLALVEAGIDRVVVDFRRLSFIDSTGLSALVNAKKRLSTEGNSLCLVIGEDQLSIRRIFEITGLDRVMAIHTDLEEAITACLGAPVA